MDTQPIKDPIAQIMKHSLVELPFSDFDQRMMQQIRRESEVMLQSKKDKNRSSLFFTLGCLFGTLFSTFLVFDHVPYMRDGKILLQAVGVLMFLLFANSVYKRLIHLGYVSRI